ncbi:MAG: substrate-binding domain-containing protein [Kiritimatiellae bacterium]|nr:substrate-binding domain-containing protein [Kiritimatiellia bacterium]
MQATDAFKIDRDTRVPAYRQLVDQISVMIRAGKLVPGDKLPPENTLSRELGVSRMTVHHAYQDLERARLVERFRARGTFVAERPARHSGKGTLTVMMRARDTWIFSLIEQDYLRGFQQECGAQGFRTAILFSSSFDEVLDAVPSEGVCVLADHLPPGPLPDYPVVLLAGWPAQPLRVDAVHSDSAHGGRLAAEHLLALGHRRLGSVVERYHHEGIRVRIDAFAEQIRRAGLPLDPRDFPAADAADSPDMRAVLQREDRPSAVFCPSDSVGLRLLRLAQELDLNVPADLSVITYDGTSLTELSTPNLTAVFADRARAGQCAAELLIGRITGAMTGPPKEVITPVMLREGGSTAPPPGV